MSGAGKEDKDCTQGYKATHDISMYRFDRIDATLNKISERVDIMHKYIFETNGHGESLIGRVKSLEEKTKHMTQKTEEKTKEETQEAKERRKLWMSGVGKVGLVILGIVAVKLFPWMAGGIVWLFTK